ncbi:hypothetical protein TDB9533_04747 [Thalassocella blandensis]|nr:hypothetical protein TDB9533_04747 [Thalassocella blandensis]
MKNLINSMRGNKPAEDYHRGHRTNMIAKVQVTATGRIIQRGPGQDAHAGIPALLRNNINAGRTPLLWAYGDELNQTVVVFGYDMFVDYMGAQVKIGHVALMDQAHISGEISLLPNNVWSIDNESGAWGGMGNESGKSEKLNRVADFMSRACNMQVRAERAYSRNAVKRWIQHKFR